MTKIEISFSQVSSGVIIPVLIFVILLGGYFVVWPKYREVEVRRATLALARSEAAIRQAQFSNVTRLIQEVKARQKELEPLDEALPQAPRIPELLVNFDELARISGLTLLGLQIVIPEENEASRRGLEVPENVQIMRVDLSLKGGYENVKAFLVNAERNLRLLDVDALVFGAVGGEPDSQDFSLQIETYYNRL